VIRCVIVGDKYIKGLWSRRLKPVTRVPEHQAIIPSPDGAGSTAAPTAPHASYLHTAEEQQIEFACAVG